MFEGPVARTRKKPEPGWTEPEKNEPKVAVVFGLEPVAVAVSYILTRRKTLINRFEPVLTDYDYVLGMYLTTTMYFFFSYIVQRCT